MGLWRGFALGLCLIVGTVDTAVAEVVRVVIDRRTVFLEGRVFGTAGAYELLEGRVFFAFDPDEPANGRIADIHLAPVGEDGRVELWTGFTVLQPLDPQQRRGIAWVDLGEGGLGATAALIQGGAPDGTVFTDPAELGDPLLLRQGVTWIQLGWEAAFTDRPGRLTLALPTALEADGSPVMGWVRLDWLVDEDDAPLSLADPSRPFNPVVVPEAPVHILTVRDGPDAARDTIPVDEWSFVLAEDGPYAGTPVALDVDGGTEAGRIYELVYRARDPRIVGLGLAVVRDVMSYARYDLDSAFPTGSGVAFGAGAGGRFLRQFLYEGFNVDEGGRPVFDAVWVHGAGAGRGQFNARFAQPGRVPSRGTDHGHPVDLFPFTTSLQFDPVSGRSLGLLPGVDEVGRPRTFATHRGHDFWARGAALTHTSVDGLRDVVPEGPDRAYHLASTLAGSSAMGVPGPDPRWTLRALAVAMLDWVDGDTPPPPSRVPTIGEGTLVPSGGVAYPAAESIPSAPTPHLVSRVDHGNRFDTDRVIDREPPELGPAFPTGVPQVDGLGNELGGVRGLEIRVPVATYLPWAVVEDGSPFRDGDPAVVPLPLTNAEAGLRGDTRPSLQYLYGSEAAFLARVRAAAEALVAEGFLLEEDREAAIAQARERWLAVVEG
ncbi:MAG: hypothetical protein KJP18_07780, partial [Gemmatimonadetes bacterium]|nr:hypothetical protein [Gemmatimonadota bacterium]